MVTTPRKILMALAVAVAVALAVVLLLVVVPRVFKYPLGSPPDDPADVLEWAQANNLLTAEEVDAVLGPGTTGPDGWIDEEACPSDEHDSLGVSYWYNEIDHPVLTADDGQFGMRECVIFETGEAVYATIERDIPVDESYERYELALVGADIVEAFAYGNSESDVQAVVVSTRDLVIFLEGWSGGTLEETEVLTQTAVDKLLG